MAYKREEKDDVIKGYRVDGETICPACMEEEELEEITKGDALTEDDLEEESFCARCMQRLWSHERGGMRKTHGAILAVIGYMILFCYAEGWGADWKLYSQTPEALYYFDVRSVNPSLENAISVEVKLTFTDKGIIEMVEQFGKAYQNISYELNHYEIDCADKKFRVSSVTRYSKNERILLRVSRDESPWIPIPPDSTSENLANMVCK